MKKVILLTMLVSVLASGFAFAKSSKTAAKSKAKAPEKSSLYYTISKEEMSRVIESYRFMKAWEAGKAEVSDEQFDAIYKNNVGNAAFSSLFIENFFRYTKNKGIQEQISKYIQANKLQDDAFAKALLKKYSAVEEEYKDGEKTLVKYSYNNGAEYDENLNHFDLNEVDPFQDGFGLMLFNNDWNVFNIKSNNPEAQKEKSVILMAGGDTNSITVTIREYNGIESEKDIPEAIKLSNVSENYKDNWEFFELEKTGILENCGADNYYVGFGIGSDKFIPEIAAGDFFAVMYKKDRKVAYVYHIYENFSKININYESRDHIYNFLKFWVQLTFLSQ